MKHTTITDSRALYVMHANLDPSTTAVVSHAVPGNHGVTSSVLSGSYTGVSAPQLTVTASQLPAHPPENASLVPASPAAVCTLVTKVAPSNQVAKVTGGPKMTAPQQGAPLKASQAAIQLPANFQIPPGE